MSAFDQGEATVRGRHPATKKALREALSDADGSAVYLRTTSAFGGYEGRAIDLPVGLTFTVVGPDPFRDRRWYANVSRRRDGKVTCR